MLTYARACTDFSVAEELEVLIHCVDAAHERAIKSYKTRSELLGVRSKEQEQLTGRHGIHERDQTNEIQCERTPAEGVEMRIVDSSLEVRIEHRLLYPCAIQDRLWAHDIVIRVFSTFITVLADRVWRHCARCTSHKEAL